MKSLIPLALMILASVCVYFFFWRDVPVLTASEADAVVSDTDHEVEKIEDEKDEWGGMNEGKLKNGVVKINGGSNGDAHNV